jgi:uncharacterized membrane protein
MQITETTTDRDLEILLGRLLRVGVSIAATFVIAGAIWYLLRHGQELPAYRVFKPLDSNHPGVKDVFEGIAAGRGRSLIQAGLLVLIATPVARVLFSLVAFARQRDWIYVAITLIVFAVLLFSFFGV